MQTSALANSKALSLRSLLVMNGVMGVSVRVRLCVPNTMFVHESMHTPE